MNDKSEKTLAWCFAIKDGLRIMEPSELLSKTYLEQAKASLLRAHKNAEKEDFLWATVVLYYAEYYALYAFLQRLGVKCENHTCSILAATLLLQEEKTKTILEHKEKRIDAQYYLKTEQGEKVRKMLDERKAFVAMFDELILKLTSNEVNDYREKLSDFIKLQKKKSKEEKETVKNDARLEKQ